MQPLRSLAITGARVLLCCATAAVLAPLPGAAAETPFAGDWLGRIGPGLRLVLHLHPGADGALTGTLDSPDQGAKDIPLGAVVTRGDSLTVEVPAVRGVYVALRIAPDSLAGEWRQNGVRLPLAMGHGSATAPPRPQEPHGPLPYEAREVTVDAGGGIRLAGTLTMPRGGGPHAAALLVSGSGPQDRNEEVFGHRPFLVLADHLTRKGIAVLRVDDRGVGGSTGSFAGATSDDFARDAGACVAWLRGQHGVDPKRVGLIGHSEGGLIAPIVADRDPDVAFVVLLAGPAVDGETVILDQSARMRRAAGEDSATVARMAAQQERIFAALAASADTARDLPRVRALIRATIDDLPEAERRQIGDPSAAADAQLRRVTSPWFRFFLRYDPQPALAALDCPALALYGSLDLQVAPALHRAPMARALARSPGGDARVRVLPGLNHLFQAAKTGLPSEYPDIEETFDPAALEAVSGWILERFGTAAKAAR